MLLTKDLIKEVENEDMVAMLKMVNIPDFTKCIAQFSGLEINRVSDDVIKQYLLTWAKNKVHLFKMLGNNTREDHKIFYEDEDVTERFNQAISELSLDFPAFTPWLYEFFEDISASQKRNVFSFDKQSWTVKRKWLKSMGYEDLSFSKEMSMTHFFSRVLKAPEKLVTRIAALYENNRIESWYTLSIDPVDMMLASENPYNWRSCYNLGTGDTCSHADGCLAAVLDDSEAIAYVWDKEGKFKLHEIYEFSSIRYKKMRQWVSFSPDLKCIHFNDIYPGKVRYSDSFKKLIRVQAETLAAAALHLDNLWRKTKKFVPIERDSYYGYGEFSSNNVYTIVKEEEEKELKGWNVYTEKLLCPCGCGQYLIPSGDCGGEDDDCAWEYSGEGFNCQNFYQNSICEFSGCPCRVADDCCEYNCESCYYWQQAHPLCEIDDEVCTAADDLEDTDSEGYVRMCDGNCSECLKYKEHKQELQREQERGDE